MLIVTGDRQVLVEQQTVISQLAEVLSEGVSLQQKCSGFSFFSQLFVELQLLPENNLKVTMVTSSNKREMFSHKKMNPV